MKTINVSAVKACLSQLLDLVVSGEEVIIARAGKPVAKLVPYQVKQPPRKPGCWRGKFKIAKDFDTTPEDISYGFQK